MHEHNDCVNKRIPEQTSQSPQATLTIHTLQPGIQSQYFNDFYLPQDIITNMTNSLSPNSDTFAHINAIIQTPITTTYSQSFHF